MATTDRFSGLCNDLLTSVISYLPARDAARTAILSRRWRPLWRRTDTLNLDNMSYDRMRAVPYAPLTQARIFSDAGAAVRASGQRLVTKLSLFVEGRDDKYCQDVMGTSTFFRRCLGRGDYDLMDALFDYPELQSIEELRLDFDPGKNEEQPYIYELKPSVLPAHTLRVLDIARCWINLPWSDTIVLPRWINLPWSGAIVLRCLSVLRLDRCSSPLKDLEDFIHTAPSLRSLHIESHQFASRCDDLGKHFAIRSASVANVTLAGLEFQIIKGIELETPCLCTLRYHGHIAAFSMKSETTYLRRVELALTPKPHDNSTHPNEAWVASFWRFLLSFRHTKVLKLKVPNIEGIAVDKHVQHKHLVTFLCLERLEIEGRCNPGRRNDAALTIANLLQCCPVIHDLQIRIISQNYQGVVTEDVSRPDFAASLNLFERRYTKDITVMIDGDAGSLEVPELPHLACCWFRCLWAHLKNVKLQFVFKELDSFEVCLAKFFAENCMVLEVLQIDDGNLNFSSHVNLMVERWRVSALERRKHMDWDSAKVSRQRGKGSMIPVGNTK